MVDNIIKSLKTETINTTDVSEVFTSILPSGDNKGDHIISRMKKNVLNVTAAMPTGNKNKKLRVIYKSKKLCSKFTIKDMTKLKHMHNIVYHGKCHDKSCSSHYGGQINT